MGPFGLGDRQEMCWNYDFQWYKGVLWEIIIFASRLELPRKSTNLVGGSGAGERWGGGGLFTSIQIPPLTLIAPLWMSQLRGNVKANYGEPTMCELERTLANSQPNLLIFQASERCGEVCVFRQRTHLLTLPFFSLKITSLFFRLNELPVTTPASRLTLVVT